MWRAPRFGVFARLYRVLRAGRHRRVPGEQDGRAGVGDRQRRAEKLLLPALPAHGDPAGSRAPGDTRRRLAESRQRANTRTQRGEARRHPRQRRLRSLLINERLAIF